jgi:TonB family protein
MPSRVASALALLALAALPAGAQSLGAVAAEEAARRRAITDPAKVLTNADLAHVERSDEGRAATPVPADAPAGTAGTDRRRQAHAPAALVGGPLPPIAPGAMGGGEVLLEVSVTASGAVAGTTVLRSTPPFTEALGAAVRGWRFQPAEDVAAPDPGARVDTSTKRPMASTVLVVGLFRPPALFPGTHGTPPETVAPPSEGAPAVMGPVPMPVYPPNALFDGVVMAELTVSATGAVGDARIVRSAAGFDQLLLDAVKSMSFRPARVHGRPAPSRVYVVAAFRQPIT